MTSLAKAMDGVRRLSMGTHNDTALRQRLNYGAVEASAVQVPALINVPTRTKPHAHGRRGCYFFSALRAFRTRACYGNVGRDHWCVLGWG